MRIIEVSKWLIIIPILLGSALALCLGFIVVMLGIRDYAAHVSHVEADAIAYSNKKLSESIDDKVLAWKKIESCKE